MTVCIPWRPTADRTPAFTRVRAWWQEHGFRIVTADSNHEMFNVSASRNAAVAVSRTSTIIVADADTIPDLHALHTALDDPNGVVYPFDAYRYLLPEALTAPDLNVAPFEREYRASVGGLLVTTQETFWHIGGFDEGFLNWGYEDNAFQLTAQTLSQVRRVPGIVYAYAHDAERDLTVSNPGRARCQLYRFAAGKPDVMRHLRPPVLMSQPA